MPGDSHPERVVADTTLAEHTLRSLALPGVWWTRYLGTTHYPPALLFADEVRGEELLRVVAACIED